MKENLSSAVQVIPFQKIAEVPPVKLLADFFETKFPEFGITESRLNLPFEASSPLDIFESWIVLPMDANPVDHRNWIGFAYVGRAKQTPRVLETILVCPNHPTALDVLWDQLNQFVKTLSIDEATSIMGIVPTHLPWIDQLYKQDGFEEISRNIRQVLTLESKNELLDDLHKDPLKEPTWNVVSINEFINGDWNSENAKQLGQLIVETDLDVPMPEEYRTNDPLVALNRNFVNKGPNGNANYSYVILEKSQSNLQSCPIGFIINSRPNNGAIMILNLGISHKHRKKGLARHLKQAAAFYLKRDHQIKEIRTQNNLTNIPVIALNQKLGYRRIAEIVTLKKANKTSN